MSDYLSFRPAKDDASSQEHPEKPAALPAQVPLSEVERAEHKIEGSWFLPKNLWILVRYRIPLLFTHGSGVDIHAMQIGNEKERMKSVMERSAQYPSETGKLTVTVNGEVQSADWSFSSEHLYSFLQVLTACTNSSVYTLRCFSTQY